jgi:hypothetical protein
MPLAAAGQQGAAGAAVVHLGAPDVPHIIDLRSLQQHGTPLKPGQLQLRVMDQHGIETLVKLSRRTPFHRVITECAAHMQLRPDMLRLTADGMVCQPDDTPGSLRLASNTVLHAMIEQKGC